MSIKSFKFVSPGVFVNEVDNSQLPIQAEDMGPVIIGRAERGPGMVPVKISSFAEFVETFGEPIAGGQASDAWRQGNRLGPTYGAFAAQAYLKNGSPVTFVRLLGEAHPNAGATAAQGAAGWSMDAAHAIKVDDDSDAAAGGTTAAIIYTNSGTGPTVAMSGDDIKITITPETAAKAATAALGTIAIADTFTTNALETATVTLTIEHAMGLGGLNSIITFDKDATGDVFSSPNILVGVSGVADDDDLLLGSRIANAITLNLPGITANYNSASRQLSLIKDDAELTGNFLTLTGLGALSIATETQGVAAVPAADGTAESFIVNFDRNSKKYIRNVLNTNPTLANASITESPISYFLGATFDQHVEETVAGKISSVDLFTMTDYGNNLAPATPAASPWVLSQYSGDTASAPSPLTSESLTKLFKMHSLYSGEWEQKNFKISVVDIKGPSNDFVKYGTFSILVRSANDSDASPVVYERFSNMNLDPTSPRYIGAVIGDMKMEWRESEKRYVHTGEHSNQSRFLRVEVASDIAAGAANAELLPFGFDVPSHDAIELVKPSFSLRGNTKDDPKLSSPKDACFGITTDRPNAVGRFDESYQDIVRPIHGTEDMLSASSVLFSLDLIRKDGVHAEFAAGSLNAGTSINSVTGATYESVLLEGFDKFTMPLCGGRDGLDITQIEPFCDDVTSGATALSHYAYNSISKAIDIVADPEVVECNLMSIPGVATPGLTGKLISVCENRGDALAIIDIENDYKPRGWDTNSESARLPSVSQAVSSLKARGLSSSYGCAFFPWVQVTDDINNRSVWMPPSVVALGTMASSAAKSELWFAPAGFTRGGLTGGAGGLPVSQVRLRLNSKDRDALYEANINPIAQFPAEGIVVFGQKTLQFTPSALDRINVRRLMIHVKKEISRMAATTLFDQNVQATWNRFLGKANPFLASVKSRFGLTEYRIILDETTTTPELIDRNIMYAKVFLKPARAIEFIAIDFTITNSGASFED
jgi:hypothetical protein